MADIKLGYGCGIKATLLMPTGAVCDLRDALFVNAVLVLPNGSTMYAKDISADNVTNAIYVRLLADRELTTEGNYSILFNVKLVDGVMYSTVAVNFANVTTNADAEYKEIVLSSNLEVTDYPHNVQRTGASPKVSARQTWLVYNDEAKAYEDTGIPAEVNLGDYYTKEETDAKVATLMEEIESLGDKTDDVDLSTLEANRGLISKTDGSWSGLLSSNYKYVIVPVKPNTRYILITGKYNTSYSFFKSYSKPTEVGQMPDYCDGYNTTLSVKAKTEVEINIPIDCHYMYIVHTSNGNNVLPTMIPYKDVQYSVVDNNLTNELMSLPKGTIVYNHNKEEDTTAYGKEGAIYRVPINDRARIVHLFFRFKQYDKMPVVDDKTFVNVGGSVKSVLYGQGMIANQQGMMYPKVQFGLHNATIGSSSTQLYGVKKKNWVGSSAFGVRYVGDIATNKDVVMIMSDTSIVIKHSTTDDVIYSVSYNQTDNVSDLVKSLNNLADIECYGIEVVNRKCSELLFDESVQIKLVQSFKKDREGTSYTDNAIQYVHYALDNRWHTFEMIVDVNSKMSYAAIDGLTLSQQFVNVIDGYIEIGTTYFPITIKDLHIGLNSWEDAEVITNTQPNFADTIQLISNNNPKLIIWEGHGVDACMDVDAPLSGSNDMTASTDRLLYVFGVLKDKGYIPVTWQDVIEWRLYGKALPKRCYCIMMDDWRIENFLKYENRVPFSKYNIKAGLAIIENYNDYTKDSIIDVDGRSYTVKEVFDILEKEGWFACSHAEHNVLGDQVISTLPTLFKKCAYDGNAIGVHENVMVYPLGSYANTIGQMENSPYCIAVMTTIAEYNCLANSDYYLGRYEIGVRASIEDVLMVIK